MTFSRFSIKFFSNSALGSDSGFIYVAQANNLSDTSNLLLSKIKLNENKLITQWTTLVPGISLRSQSCPTVLVHQILYRPGSSMSRKTKSG